MIMHHHPEEIRAKFELRSGNVPDEKNITVIFQAALI